MCKKALVLPDRVVPCGHCIECLIKRSQEWAFRLEQEGKTASSGMFITLTYNDENAVWITNDDNEVLTTLVKTDCQNFIKRLRRAQKSTSTDYRQKIRYYCCGEYGITYNRAHYHYIIFNADANSRKFINKIWGKGFVKLGEVTPKSIRYTTNYMLLKEGNLKEGQAKPFTLMSKKPILGANYVANNYTHHTKTQDYKLQETSHNKRNLYRSLEKHIFTNKELEEISVKKRAEFAIFHEKKLKEAEDACPLDPYSYIQEKKEHKEKIYRSRLKTKL